MTDKSIRKDDTADGDTHNKGFFTENEAIYAFMALDPDAEKPSDAKTAEGDADEEDETASEDADAHEDDEDLEDDEDDETDPDEDTEDADDNDEDDGEDGDEDKEPLIADEDAVVEFKVGDKVQTASVKELKRLAGQEAALTQKSQKASQLARVAEARHAQTEAILTKLKERADARAKQYEGLDLIELAQSGQYSKEDIAAARAGMEEAQKEVSYFEQSLEEFYSQTQADKAARLQEEAQDALTHLEDEASVFHVPQFKARYNSLVEAGQEAGIPDEVLATTPGPWLWKLIDSHVRYTNAKLKLTGKKSAKKSKKGTRKVLRSRGTERRSTPAKNGKRQAAMKALRSRPDSRDAAVDAFLALEG